MKRSNKGKGLSRRSFVRDASLAGASFFIVPRHVLGKGHVAPSDILNIAGIGAGGKGESDMENFSKSPKARIVSMCDVDESRAVKSRERFPKATFYKDFREMLDKEGKIIAKGLRGEDLEKKLEEVMK